jgi:hypothetical protein
MIRAHRFMLTFLLVAASALNGACAATHVVTLQSRVPGTEVTLDSGKHLSLPRTVQDDPGGDQTLHLTVTSPGAAPRDVIVQRDQVSQNQVARGLTWLGVGAVNTLVSIVWLGVGVPVAVFGAGKLYHDAGAGAVVITGGIVVPAVLLVAGDAIAFSLAGVRLANVNVAPDVVDVSE